MTEPQKRQTAKIVAVIFAVAAMFITVALTYKENQKKRVAKPLHTPLPAAVAPAEAEGDDPQK